MFAHAGRVSEGSVFAGRAGGTSPGPATLSTLWVPVNPSGSAAAGTTIREMIALCKLIIVSVSLSEQHGSDLWFLQ